MAFRGASQIILPKPGAEFGVGENIALEYRVEVKGLPLPEEHPTVDILLQKEGEDFAIEIADALKTHGKDSHVRDGVLHWTIEPRLYGQALLHAGEYNLFTVQHNTDPEPTDPHGRKVRRRQITGHQKLFLVEIRHREFST